MSYEPSAYLPTSYNQSDHPNNQYEPRDDAHQPFLPQEYGLNTSSVASTPEAALAGSGGAASLDQLESFISSNDYESALELSLRLQLEPSYTSYLAQRVYLHLTQQQASSGGRRIELKDLENLFPLIVDDEWLAQTACHLIRTYPDSSKIDRSEQESKDNDILRYALIKGLEASDVLALLRPELGQLIEEDDTNGLEQLLSQQHNDPIRKGCLVRKTLLEMKDKESTWDQIWGPNGIEPKAVPPPNVSHEKVGDSEKIEAAHKKEHDDTQSDVEEEAGDGWGDMNIEEGNDVNKEKAKISTTVTAPVPFSSTTTSTPSLALFLSQSLIEIALSLAASSQLDALKIIISHHSIQLWPFRFVIISTIPEWQDPADYLELLPALGSDQTEQRWLCNLWREEKDWVENIKALEDDQDTESADSTPPAENSLLSADRLTQFYTSRIEHIASLGLISTALTLVQHCATLLNMSSSKLEELGEELSLLSRLVYDRPEPSSSQHASSSKVDILNDDHDRVEDYDLAKWRSMQPSEIIRSYLSTSDTTTIASTIRRLVLPYLSVLEARLERSGEPDPQLASRLLNKYLLSLVEEQPPRLDLLLSVFEASKPTLALNMRLIKSDEDLARLAIACLYGCRDSSAETLIQMGQIFECLPAFSSATTIDDTTDSQATKTTLYTLVPSNSEPPTSSSLYNALLPFKASSLSTSLDLLDLHLSQAETFSRYSCPVPLSWFLLHHTDLKAQRAWATRLARTASTGGGGKRGEEGEFESEDEWVALMEDMVGLTQGREEEGQDMRKAFGLLEEEEVLRIFFGGLIAAGRISLAKSLLQPSSRSAPLEPKSIEQLIIAASREFYDNAPSGNINKGEMKMAFDCLAAAPQTPAIRRERDFIEATSRLCSFKINSHPDVPVAPIEIRLSKDRLEFVARLLGSNEDAYRHPDVVLDLVNKLGYRGDALAEVRTLAMIADSSLQAGDFERTVEVCDRMVAKVDEIRSSQQSGDTTLTSALDLEGQAGEGKKKDLGDEAAEYAWRECFQLGKHELFQDLDRRMTALGQALLLCPGDKIVNILPVWTALEERVVARPTPTSRARTRNERGVGAGVGAGVEAAGVKAKETLSRAAAFFAGAAGNVGHVIPGQHYLQQHHSPKPPSESCSASSSSRDKTADKRSSIYSIDQLQPASSSAYPQSAPPTSSVFSASRTTNQVPPPPASPRARQASSKSGAPGGAGAGGYREGGFRAGISGFAAAGVGWLIGADEEREKHLQQQQYQPQPQDER